MSIQHRLVIEIDATLLDETWTEQELLENAALYLASAIGRAENESATAGERSYTLDSDELTVWTQGGYAEDHAADLDEV